MKVKELAKRDEFQVVVMPDENREITNVYIGDLLSWVMGKANADCIWLTIMSNLNICAVASLTDAACILLLEGVEPDPGVIQTAKDKNINILKTDRSAYEAVLVLNKIAEFDKE